MILIMPAAVSPPRCRKRLRSEIVLSSIPKLMAAYDYRLSQPGKITAPMLLRNCRITMALLKFLG